MLRLYHRCGFGGMGGALLPEAGGVMDQLALTMQAFGVIGAVEAEYRETSQEAS